MEPRTRLRRKLVWGPPPIGIISNEDPFALQNHILLNRVSARSCQDTVMAVVS